MVIWIDNPNLIIFCLEYVLYHNCLYHFNFEIVRIEIEFIFLNFENIYLVNGLPSLLPYKRSVPINKFGILLLIVYTFLNYKINITFRYSTVINV